MKDLDDELAIEDSLSDQPQILVALYVGSIFTLDSGCTPYKHSKYLAYVFFKTKIYHFWDAANIN